MQTASTPGSLLSQGWNSLVSTYCRKWFTLGLLMILIYQILICTCSWHCSLYSCPLISLQRKPRIPRIGEYFYSQSNSHVHLISLYVQSTFSLDYVCIYNCYYCLVISPFLNLYPVSPFLILSKSLSSIDAIMFYVGLVRWLSGQRYFNLSLIPRSHKVAEENELSRGDIWFPHAFSLLMLHFLDAELVFNSICE